MERTKLAAQYFAKIPIDGGEFGLNLVPEYHRAPISALMLQRRMSARQQFYRPLAGSLPLRENDNLIVWLPLSTHRCARLAGSLSKSYPYSICRSHFLCLKAASLGLLS